MVGSSHEARHQGPAGEEGRDVTVGAQGDRRVPWRLPEYIWQDWMRQMWLELAEEAFREGYEESFRARLEQSVILRLFFWRSIEVPPSVRKKVRETEDLAQLRLWRERAYHVTDPEHLFQP
ncbi:hypothetical protein [Streptomyces sp. NPDC014995]|uniref:hypothetical protein n=1 Tax=Streptomyces sp. NPDC014995 TaxID=3364936 RepID=UPI0036FD3088